MYIYTVWECIFIMKKIVKKSHKFGELYLLTSLIVCMVAIFAGLLKVSAFGTETLDIAPLSNERKENITLPEKYTEQISNEFEEAKQNTNNYTKSLEKEIKTYYVTKYIATCKNNTKKCFTDVDAERGVVQYKKYFYAHSNYAFDGLKTTYVGDILKVVDKDGITRTFRIDVRTVKSVGYLNGAGKEDGFTGNVYRSKYNNKQYSASFMTCGNGSNNDSNYRLILFATEI